MVALRKGVHALVKQRYFMEAKSFENITRDFTCVIKFSGGVPCHFWAQCSPQWISFQTEDPTETTWYTLCLSRTGLQKLFAILPSASSMRPTEYQDHSLRRCSCLPHEDWKLITHAETHLEFILDSMVLNMERKLLFLMTSTLISLFG